VLVGPLTGIAVVMIVSQLTKITGVPVDGETLPVVSVSCRSGPNPSAVTGCLGTRCGRTRHWMRSR
jgi:MFS superfamily sulfate permease-like transporter